MKRSTAPVTRSLKIPSIYAIAVVATIVLAAALTMRGSASSLTLLLLRVPDFAVVAVWIISAFGYGAALPIRSTILMNRALRIVTLIAVGLGIESFLILACGLIGWIGACAGWIILLFGVLAAVVKRGALARSPGTPEEVGGEEQTLLWLWLLPIAVLTISCICAMLPPGLLWGDEPNGYDVVEYHLQVPREWYELGRIVPLTHNVFSYFPFNVEMHYLLAMMACHGPWAGMYVAQLMHVTFIALTVMAVYGLLVDRSRAAATVAAVAIATTPWCGLLASVAYDEGGYLLWSTLAIGLLLRRDVILAGLMAGFACGSKWTAVPIVLLAAPLAVLVMRIVPWRSVLWYCAIGVVVVSPWLLRNMAWSHDPVFPELTGIFGRAHWSNAQVIRWHQAHLPRANQAGIFVHLQALGEQVIGDWRFGFILLPAAVLAAVLNWRDRQSGGIALIVLALAGFWLFFTHLQGRFFVLALPLSALLIGLAAIRWPMQAAVAGWVIGVVGFAFLARRVMEIDARLFQLIGVARLNGLTPFADSPPADDASVVLIGDAKAFWYQTSTSRLFYRTVFDVDVKPGQSVVDAWAAGTPSSNVARVFDPGELLRFSRTYAGIPQPPPQVLRMPGPMIDWGTVQPAKAF